MNTLLARPDSGDLPLRNLLAPGWGPGSDATSLTRAPTMSPTVLRAGLLLGCAASAAIAVATAAWLGGPSAPLRADPELASLLRGMALIKAALVLAAVGLLHWRFGHPIARGHALAYGLGACMVTGATSLIWQLTAIGVAALVFHLGGLALLCMAFADGRGRGAARPIGESAAMDDASGSMEFGPAPR